MSTFRDIWSKAIGEMAQISRNKSAAKSAVDAELMNKLGKIASLPTLEALHELRAQLPGLPPPEVEARLEQFGKNEIAQEKVKPWFLMLLGNFKNPFIGVLVVLGLVSYFTDDIKAAIVVSLMVILSVIMRFLQEYRSSKEAEALKAMVKTTATVTRQIEIETEAEPILQSKKIEIPFENVVPGDLIHLSAGDMVPADVRLISSKDLFITESALTGESMPVEKFAQPPQLKNAVLEKQNLCFLGTNVVSGSGSAVVIATGERTFFGSLAKSIVGHRTLTSFDKGVNKVSWLLIRFMMIMVPVVFVINGVMKGNWQDAFLFAIAVAVGLTPEMLPMIVTANLAKGAVMMSKHKVVVKRLNSIQNLGAMDILCTDKTGTLTQDKIILEEYLNIDGKEDPRVLKYGYLNSYYQTGLKNLLDRAILDHFQLTQELQLPHQYEKIDEIPFDFVRRRMSVIVKKRDGSHSLICKGAAEEILSVCDRVERERSTAPLTPELKQQVKDLIQDRNENGCRIVAVAYKIHPAGTSSYSVSDETNLILMGVIAFLDPPKETASEAVRLLKSHGVGVKILTGDNEIITRRVCKEVGIEVMNLMQGHDLEGLSEKEIAMKAEQTNVFTKLTPAQKSSIIKALQQQGHTVGFLGDGINDAPALRQADVGISVDSATDIARESADIILLEKSLLVLEDGVIKGREVYGNIIKYIKMTASSNFGNVFSVLVASAFLPFLPMLSVHLLIQNLLYDLSQTALPWDHMDKEFLQTPKKWEPSGIARFMIFIGPISSIFDIVTFLVMWYVFKANNVNVQSVFQSGWFIEGLLSQTLVVHMIRTQKVPFVQSIASFPVMVTTFLIMSMGIILPFTQVGHSIGFTSLPMTYFPWLLVILVSYCVLTQIVKNWYIRRFQTWL